jgi:predicted 2-oxoglutarate/Fe(II)-dependent dioxygenase YbiX/peroxiredoxin
MTSEPPATVQFTAPKPAQPAKGEHPWLTPGDPAPWFKAPSNVNPNFDFATAAGRIVVLCFFGSGSDPAMRPLIDGILEDAGFFAHPDYYFFGVSSDHADRNDGRLTQQRPGMDIFWDLDGRIGRLYRALPDAPGALAKTPAAIKAAYRPVTYVLDYNLRVVATVAHPEAAQHAAAVRQLLKRLPKLPAPRPAVLQAPVLVLPSILERDLCRQLVDGYRANGGKESGFMRDRDGKTVLVLDHKHKRRSDWVIEDAGLRSQLQERIKRRLVPEIEKAFQFKVSRMERYIVACYDAEPGGYFKAHRDNTTKGTAHRRFAVTVNLNSEEYEGGDLMFPEFGRAVYRAPTGGAVVFSCSMLHEALPVTKGQRFAFLPFLYDEAAAKVREENNQFLSDDLKPYLFEEGQQVAAAAKPASAGKAAAKAKPAAKQGTQTGAKAAKSGGKPAAKKRK